MNCKKLLISSIVVMTALTTQVYAKELQAQVQKNTANTTAKAVASAQAYPEISKLVEYNHCATADENLNRF